MLLLARRGAPLAQLALRSVASLPAATASISSQTFVSDGQSSSSKSSYYAAAGALGLVAGATAFGTQLTSLADAPNSTPPPAVAPVTDPYQKPTELHGLPKKIVLYQYEICPFCCKVKAFLDYNNIPYYTVEVNPLTKAETKWSTYRKVPIVKLDDEVVVDSSAIITRLAAEVDSLNQKQAAESAAAVKAPKKMSSWLFGSSKSSSKQADSKEGQADGEDEETKWRKWVDETLVRLVTANIYRNWKESWQTMGYISDVVNWGYVNREAARSAGAIMMWQVGKRLPKKYSIEGDLREALYAALAEFLAAVGDKPFLGGSKPNLGDLAAFGVLRTVVGTDTFSDVMANTDVAPWYDRMRGAVGHSARIPGDPHAAE